MDVKSLPSDRMSSLPSTIIETILCLVPIRDAVRTSILSTNWRHKWVTIPKLLFDANDMFDNSNDDEHQSAQPPNERKHLTDKCKVFYAIYQVLLQHQGPIVEFSLSMKADSSCVEIDQIILHLSTKNTLKQLSLDLMDNNYRLPPSIFSFQHLTDLSLKNCRLDLDPVPLSRSRALGSLTSLSLIDVNIFGDTFEHLISANPLLKPLSVMLWDEEIDAENLDFEIELYEFTPVIEHLSIWSGCLPHVQYSHAGSGKVLLQQDLPITLVHLKSLCIMEMLFDYKFQIHGLFTIIRMKIKLVQEILKNDTYINIRNQGGIMSLVDYSDIRLEHLKELEIENFINLEVEMEFVKLILAKSPVLKKLTIRLSNWIKNDEELKMLRILLRCRRASPSAEIIVVERHILKRN